MTRTNMKDTSTRCHFNFFRFFWDAKFAVFMYGWSVKEIFSTDEWGQEGKGQVHYGWCRESFECIQETLRTHTKADVVAEFAKPVRDQDPYFGATAIVKVFLRTFNAARYVSELLSFDHEICAQLGRLLGMSFCPDKKNKRGVKNFSLKGCNHVSLSDKAPKGYYFWLH